MPDRPWPDGPTWEEIVRRTVKTTIEAECSSLEARIKELEEYKEYHEFAEGQIEYVIGEPVTTLGRMAERFEELKADLAAVAPVVRAAVEHEQGYRGSWETGPNGEGLVFRPSICGCGVCMAVCALHADVLERMGVER